MNDKQTAEGKVAVDEDGSRRGATGDENIRTIRGYCDGARGEEIGGWALDPDNPAQPVWVEISLNGIVVGEALADNFRPDLRAAGIGSGRHAWRFTLAPETAVDAPMRVVVRSRGGDILENGEFILDLSEPIAAADQERCDEFVAAVLGERPSTKKPPADAPPPRANFLLHSPVALSASNFGRPEYSYAFVREAFEELLSEIGTVYDTPDVETVDRLYGEISSRGETAVLMSFAPPYRMLAGSRSPVVPVIAWEFPTIPMKAIGGEPRHDWRLPLRESGRAIALSWFAADAIKAAMGAEFPVTAIPTPVWDKFAPLYREGARPAVASVRIEGFVYDTHGRSYSAGGTIGPVPDSTNFADYGDTARITGTVFTSVFSPHDRRKNWGFLLIAFLAAHRERASAVLVLKMISADPASWWWELHDILNSMAGFRCRVIVLHGYLDKTEFGKLVTGSDWIVSASNAEGLCMPLVEFMAGGTPAITPRHTAMSEYITTENALIVDSSEEWDGFPHEPNMEYGTTRHRVAWDSLVAAFDNGYRIATDLPERYEAYRAAANETMRSFCSRQVVAQKLDSFLGLHLSADALPQPPSELIRLSRHP